MLVSDRTTERDGLSRRGFLAGAAAGAGATVAAGMAAADTRSARADEGTEGGFESMPMAIGHVVHDPDKCSGCRDCEIICSLNKFGVVNSELSSIRINTDVQVTDINAAITDEGISVTGMVTPTYTQDFEAKVKTPFFDEAGNTLYFSERLVIDVPIGASETFEDFYPTDDPSTVKSINLEVMCGKIAG